MLFLRLSIVFLTLSLRNASMLYRKSKFWNVGIVKFANSECLGVDGAIGTCYTRRQCRDLGGLPAGRCAGNIGVCCVVQESCGSYSSLNNTYFVTPAYQNSFSLAKPCTLIVRKCNSDICQLRIDLIDFNLAQPDANGTCCIDSFRIKGGGSLAPTLCGQNNGQHLYVNFDDNNQEIRLTIEINPLIAQARSWRMKIAQIDCECPTKAPSGCLQYYTKQAGMVHSFNYATMASSALNANNLIGTRQLAHLNYGVCVAMLAGYCAITWRQSANDLFAFSVSNDTNGALMTNILGTAAAYANGTNCLNDFVIIPNGFVNDDVAAVGVDRFCGNALPTITSYSKPFVLTVITDGADLNDTANRGFALSYMQQACTAKCLNCV